MKKLFAVLFCTFVMSGYAFADELSYEIDSVATAKAPWKVGETIIKSGNCMGQDYYREFLGIAQSGLALVQDFYLSNEKLTDPYLMPVTNADKNTHELCREGIDGNYTVWHKNGKKKAEITYKDGKLENVMTTWYENGQKKLEINYKNSKYNGPKTTWYENGQKEFETNYKNGDLDGPWIKWHENGKKDLEYNYKNGKLEGLFTGWHINGQKKSEGNFKNGKEVGIWREWDEKGNLIEEKDYGKPKK